MTGYRDEIGQTLCAARHAAGLSLRDIAAEIRVKPIYLQAIEAGQFELLPALPQTLGFTRAYARHLNVDVEAPLVRLGEEVHRNIESADFSAPELPWSDVPLRRFAWVGAGSLLGLGLLATMLFDFGPAPITSDPALQARAVPVEVPAVRPAAPAPEAPAVAAAAPVRSVYGSSPVSAAFAAMLFNPETASASASAPAVEAEVAPVASADVEAPVQVAAVPAVFVVKDVYLRASPANEARAVAVLNACEPVTVLGESAHGQWQQVGRADGVTGFVYHRFVGAEPATACR